MSESQTIIAGLKIQESGIFRLEDLYKQIKEWLNFQGFGDQEKTFREEKYVERIKGDSKQIDVAWKAEKIINDYLSYVMTITFNIAGLVDIELEHDGIKTKTNKGLIIIRISSKLILDRQNKWESNFFKNIYQKYIQKERILSHAEELYSKTYSLHNEIKAFFEIPLE